MVLRRLLPLLVLAFGALAGAPTALAAACGAGAVTPVHSPDGTTRPLYGDWSHGATKHSGYVGYELTGFAGSDPWIKLSGFTGGSVGLAANQSASIPARATSQAGKPLVYAYLTASAATTTAQAWTVEVWNGKPGQTGSTQVCTATDGFSSVIDVISANANKITSISVSTSSPAIGGSFDVTAVGDTGTMGAGDASDRSGGNGVFSMAPAMDDSWPADSFTLTGVSVSIGGATTRDRLRIYPGTAAAGAYTAVYTFTVRKAPAAATAVYPVQNIASGTQVKYTGSYPSTPTSIAVPTITTTLVKSTQSLSGPPYALTYKVVAANTSAGATVLDYLRDTPTSSAAWTFAGGTAKLNGVAIPDPVNDAGTLVFSGPFTVPAASGATPGTLTFLYTLDVAGTVSNSVVGQVGDVLLGGSSAGDNQVTVNPALPSITTTSLSDATAGSAYSVTLGATGGTAPYTWSVLSGPLPAGLSLNPLTGVLSGTPTTAGSSSFTIAVTDAATGSSSRTFTITTAAASSGPGDSVAPTGSLTIDGGATATTSTSVTLGLSATDAVGVSAYRVAEGTDCSGASWVAVSSTTSFTASIGFTLSGGDGAKTVCVQYADAAGNSSASATATITLDAAPTVALSTSAPDPTNAALAVTATFSKPVTGFTVADVGVGNGTASAFSGAAASYTFTVTPSAQGGVTVDVGAGVATSAAGTANLAATQLARSFDSVRPAVTLAAAAGPFNGSFGVTATFSEPVTGLAVGAIAVTNGTASNLAGSGTTYTFEVAPAGDGAVTVGIGAGGAADAAGNSNTASASLARRHDGTRPGATLSSAAAATVGAAFGVTLSFDEPVTGVTLGGLAVTNGTVSNLAGSGATYTFTVTPTAQGDVTVDVAAGAAVDAAGNGSLAATTLTRRYDSAAPSVTLSSPSPSPLNGAFTVSATFSEDVTGLSLGDVSVDNGTVSNLAGSGATYTFDVAPTGDGPVTVDLVAGAAADAAGNASTAAAQLTRDFDGTRPSVTLSSVSTTPVNGVFTVTAAFSEPVTGLTLGAVTVANGAASNLAGSGAVYTFDVTPSSDGTVAVDVAAGAAADAAGNASTAAATLSRSFDGTRPTVLLATSAADPTAAAFTVTATFSEPVTGLSLFDLVVGNGVASNLLGSGTTYTFDIAPAAQGAVTVDLPGGSAADAAGNASTAAARLARAYDTTRPSVALSGGAIAGGSFTVTATFSEAVTGFTLGNVAVGNGAASNLAGSGSTYTFQITAARDGAVTVDVVADAAVDAAGNGNTTAAQLTRLHDGTRPTVALTSGATSPLNGPFTVTATFSEPVTGLALGSIAVGNGTVSNLRGSGATYLFDVTPAAEGDVTVDLADGAAVDAAGNGSTVAAQLARTYDGTRPGVTVTTAAPSPTRTAFTVTVTFTKPVTGLTLGDLVVGDGVASDLAGSGTTYTFDVAPTADGTVTVDLPAGSANDAAGNGSLAAPQLSRSYDATRPALTLTAGEIADGVVTVTATFGEPVEGFALGDIAVGNGTASTLAGSGSVYTFRVRAAAEGSVTVSVPAGAAVDAAGNASTAATTLSRAWTPPAATVALTDTPVARTGDTDARFTFATEDGATVTCSLDGAPATPCSSPLAVHDLAPGGHTLVVHAVNEWGVAATKTFSWTVLVRPGVVFTLHPPDESEGDGVLTWLSDAPGVTFTCSLDAAEFSACTSPVFFRELADGTHTFTVRAEAGGATTSSTVTWTVRRGGTPPPASVVILPKITAKDMEGRPQPFRTAADTARSKGPFTRKLDVGLRIPTPEDVGSDVVYISNYADFRDVKVFPIAKDELYDWELLAGPSGDRPVWIRFSSDPDAAVGQATIVLDQELPVLTPRFLGIGRTMRASAARTAAAVPACGGAARRWLHIGGADRFSGLNAVQIASDPSRPCAWRPFLPEFSYRLPSRIVYVRVVDRVGNISDWYRVDTRR